MEGNGNGEEVVKGCLDQSVCSLVRDTIGKGAIEADQNCEDYVKKLLSLVSSSNSDEVSQLVDCIKCLGNEEFSNANYSQAVNIYTMAIGIDENNPVLYTNRSAANIRLENYGYALEDADRAILLDPAYVKAYYRKATSYMALGRYKDALNSFELVCRAIPNDKAIQRKLSDCRRQIHRLAFERAISMGSSSPEAEFAIDVNTIDVPGDYTGPRLDESGTVTPEFVKQLTDHFRGQKTLNRRYAYQILLKAREHFKNSKTLVRLDIPEGTRLTICGDVHGQYYDLLNIFEINGNPSLENPYLFNGDFVDRGSFSTECIFLLLSYKLLYPDKFFMTRGNHEAITMNEIYGFTGEIKAKYDDRMFKLFTEIFNYLPLCFVLNEEVAVMHGGLFSNDDVTLEDIQNIDRVKQPPDSGLMCDILWSDPCGRFGRQPSKRGVGLQFGPDVTSQFCKNNNLKYIVRSHEVQAEGVEIIHNGQCITVFSAPNYCDTINNKGAFLRVNHKLEYEVVKFEAVPHPDVKAMAYASTLSLP